MSWLNGFLPGTDFRDSAKCAPAATQSEPASSMSGNQALGAAHSGQDVGSPSHHGVPALYQPAGLPAKTEAGPQTSHATWVGASGGQEACSSHPQSLGYSGQDQDAATAFAGCGEGLGGAGAPPDMGYEMPSAPGQGYPQRPSAVRPRYEQPAIQTSPLVKRLGPLVWAKVGSGVWKGVDSRTKHVLYRVTGPDSTWMKKVPKFYAGFRPEFSSQPAYQLSGSGYDGHFSNLEAAQRACEADHNPQIQNSREDSYPEIWQPQVRNRARD